MSIERFIRAEVLLALDVALAWMNLNHYQDLGLYIARES